MNDRTAGTWHGEERVKPEDVRIVEGTWNVAATATLDPPVKKTTVPRESAVLPTGTFH